MVESPPLEIQIWPIDRLVLYARNPRKNDAVVDRMCSSILEFGFKIPVLARNDGEVVDGHLRIRAARKLGIDQIPVILCDEWTPAQVKAFRLLVNRSVTWAAWDEELLALELHELSEADFDLDLTGFNPGEIDGLLAIPDEERANATPPVPENPVSRAGDLWLCDKHRVLCGDATNPEAVARLLADRQPLLMVTDPPYGIELDSEWRDRAGLNGGDFGGKRTKASKARSVADPQYHAEPSYLKRRTEGHTETTISGDTKADWSDAFELVPSLQINHLEPVLAVETVAKGPDTGKDRVYAAYTNWNAVTSVATIDISQDGTWSRFAATRTARIGGRSDQARRQPVKTVPSGSSDASWWG